MGKRRAKPAIDTNLSGKFLLERTRQRHYIVVQCSDRPKSWVIEQAVSEFIATQSWQLAAIDEGIKAADEGRVAAHADIDAWVKSWDEPDEKPMPECG
jgi:predicted transcriptional regulator